MEHHEIHLTKLLNISYFFSNCGIGPEALKRTINTGIVCQSIETESSVRPKFWTNLLEE